MKLTAPESEDTIQSQKWQGLRTFWPCSRGYYKCAINRLAFSKQESEKDVKILFMFPIREEEDQSQWL